MSDVNVSEWVMLAVIVIVGVCVVAANLWVRNRVPADPAESSDGCGCPVDHTESETDL